MELITRRLWASNAVQLHYSHVDNPANRGIFVSRDILCAASDRFRDLLAPTRSWPIIDWASLWKNQSQAHKYWNYVPKFIEFIHVSSRRLDSAEEEDHDSYMSKEWCMGAGLGAPKYQNYIMKEKMLLDASLEADFLVDEYTTLATCIREEAEGLQDHELDITIRGKYQKHKLADYILDKVVWDGARGGTIAMELIQKGGSVALAVARRQVRAAKKPAPRFPPWHVFNHYKYLLSEEALEL